MAGPKAQDDYNPVNSVAPQTNMPGDYLSTRATPDAFGAQIGQAENKLGSTLEDVGNKGIDVAVQQQGLFNEHAANVGDMTLATEGGKIYQGYKDLTGFDAVNSKDKAVSDYMNLSNKIRDSLGNPGAQRAYDQLATRRLSFTVQDMNAYASSQQKEAYKTGNAASIGLATDEASRYDVATSPAQLGNSLGSIVFNANALYTAPDYGKYQTLPVTTDPKNGHLQFDQSTTQGKSAQQDYDFYLQKQTGQAYKNAALTIAYDAQKGNVLAASQFIENNKNSMPSATYAELSHQFAPGVQNEIVRSGVDGIMQNDARGYQVGSFTGKATPDQLTDSFIQQESSGGKTSANLGQIQPGTWSQFARPGENINNPDDNRAVTSRILSKYSTDYGDVSRIAVAYNSGPNNVAPPGSPTPWIHDYVDPKNGKSVSSYVSDINGRLGGIDPSKVNSYVDHLGVIEPQLIQQARDLFPNDAARSDLAASRAKTYIDTQRSAQYAQDRANEDGIVSDLYSGKIKGQVQLDSDPRWGNLMARNSLLAVNLETHVIPSLARGMQTEYGTDFYKHLQSTLNGSETTTSLSGYVGGDKNSPITNNGYKVLTDVLGKSGTADAAFNHAESQFLQGLHSQFTGAGQFPGVSPTESNAQFDKALMEVIPKINAARAAGKTPAQLFTDPKNPDYITTGVPPPSRASLMNQMVARTMAQNTATTASPGATVSYKSPDDLVSALRNKSISRQQFDQIAISNKWASAPAPSVPPPTDN